MDLDDIDLVGERHLVVAVVTLTVVAAGFLILWAPGPGSSAPKCSSGSSNPPLGPFPIALGSPQASIVDGGNAYRVAVQSWSSWITTTDIALRVETPSRTAFLPPANWTLVLVSTDGSAVANFSPAGSAWLARPHAATHTGGDPISAGDSFQFLTATDSLAGDYLELEITMSPEAPCLAGGQVWVQFP